MAKRSPKQWSKVDVPAERLLERIGASDLDYYSAAEDRAVGEALRAWPLLEAVSRVMRADGALRRRRPSWPKDATPIREADPPIRVVSPEEEKGP